LFEVIGTWYESRKYTKILYRIPLVAILH
jgi:hypothetical protein